MVTTRGVIDALSYESVLFHTLADLGLAPEEAAAIFLQRWPMEVDGVLSECYGRGLALTTEDLTSYLRSYFGPHGYIDGEPITARDIGWNEKHVNGVLAWALENGRGEPRDESGPPPHVSVADMLDSLRSSDIVVRTLAASMLARSLGTGCALNGEHPEDFELLLAPQLSALLGRAAAGDASAVDELETAIKRG
jgi:hypothetical protein